MNQSRLSGLVLQQQRTVYWARSGLGDCYGQT